MSLRKIGGIYWLSLGRSAFLSASSGRPGSQLQSFLHWEQSCGGLEQRWA